MSVMRENDAVVGVELLHACDLTLQDGAAVYGGANDPRMGTLDFNTRCRTCDCTYTGIGGNQVNDCPGHFGHMEVKRSAASSDTL